MKNRRSQGGGSDNKPDTPEERAGRALDRLTFAQVVRAALEARFADNQQKSEPDSRLLCERCGSLRHLIATLPADRRSSATSVLQCVGCEIIDLLRT